jgi:hypothetical protein
MTVKVMERMIPDATMVQLRAEAPERILDFAPG